MDCLNDSPSPGSNRILFSLEGLFYVGNLSKCVHIHDRSNNIKFDMLTLI